MKKKQITGTYEEVGGFGRVIPHERKEVKEVLILQGSELGAKPGDQVAVELLPEASYRGIKRRSGVADIGKVLEVLGGKNDVAAAEKALIRRLGLRESFPPKVLDAAAKISQAVGEKDVSGRLDLRGELIFTIDGEDTRDIDDAISLAKKADGGWRLGVHIADVSHYVSAGSPLDKEAYLRGTSVYFPDAVLPMLPPALSNGICSLNPGEDRLAVSCLMELDPSGKVRAYEIRPTAIRSREKLSYPQVQAYFNRKGFRTKDALEGKGSPVDPGARAQDFFHEEATGDMLLEMARLSLLLRQNRLERGALDFELPECKIMIDEKGEPAEIRRRHRMLSEMVIEEFMILANETVASHYRSKAVPFPYRLHPKPSRESLFALNQFLRPLGYFVKAERDEEGRAQRHPVLPSGIRQKGKIVSFSVPPRAYQRVIQQVKGRPEEAMVSTMLLRSLTHASYSPQEEGHFGLASECYCHFTSPIRRYPDLLVHRIIKEYGMKGRPDKAAAERQRERLGEQCAQASVCERAAEDAERKADSLWKAAYMSQFIGEEFDASVSGVTSYGLYVALENTVEGLIHVSNMEDYYEFDERNQTLSSWRRHKIYRMGDPIRVRLTGVDIGAGYVDFIPAENGGEAGESGGPAKKAGGDKPAGEKSGAQRQGAGRPGAKVVAKSLKSGGPGPGRAGGGRGNGKGRSGRQAAPQPFYNVFDQAGRSGGKGRKGGEKDAAGPADKPEAREKTGGRGVRTERKRQK